LRHPVVIAVVAILGFVPLSSLNAQPVTYYPDANWDLPPAAAIAIVRLKGLEPLSRPQRQGVKYVLRALDPTNREVQVTVDARSGRILHVIPTAGAAGRALPSTRAARAPRPNVVPAAKLTADAAGSKSDAEAARPPKVVADAASLSASAEAPVQTVPGPEIEE
jgi:hypothetical protein